MSTPVPYRKVRRSPVKLIGHWLHPDHVPEGRTANFTCPPIDQLPDLKSEVDEYLLFRSEDATGPLDRLPNNTDLAEVVPVEGHPDDLGTDIEVKVSGLYLVDYSISIDVSIAGAGPAGGIEIDRRIRPSVNHDSHEPAWNYLSRVSGHVTKGISSVDTFSQSFTQRLAAGDNVNLIAKIVGGSGNVADWDYFIGWGYLNLTYLGQWTPPED